jgi:alpha-galactosidase
LRFPGLDPGRRYRVVRRAEVGVPAFLANAQPAWWGAAEPPEVSGAFLAEVGLAAPLLHPAQATLIDLSAG